LLRVQRGVSLHFAIDLKVGPAFTHNGDGVAHDLYLRVAVLFAKVRVRKHRDSRLLAEDFGNACGVESDLRELFGAWIDVDGAIAHEEAPILEEHRVNAGHDVARFSGPQDAEARADRLLVRPVNTPD